MRQEVTLQITGDAPHHLLAGAKVHVIDARHCRITVSADSETAKNLFSEVADRSADGWFISWHEIRRYYTDEEYQASEYIHVAVRRGFVEAMSGDFAEFYDSFIDDEGCRIIRAQTDLIFLGKPLRSKDDLVWLTDGAWLCKPSFAKRLASSGLECPPLTPVFSSRRKRDLWKSTRRIIESPEKLLLEDYFLAVEEFDEFHWLHMHPSVGPFSIAPPTVTGTEPYLAPSSDTLCACEEVFGPGITSELHLRQTGLASGDWFLTRQFVGWGGEDDLFPPKRILLVSNRCFQFLRTCRLHSSDLDCVHLV
jgi:hypothetical protein